MNRKGPWSATEIDRFLRESRVPVRLACNGTAGYPVLASLWYLHREGRLWCATQRTARIVSHLGRNPLCAFEVAQDTAPYRGVRGQAVARLHPECGERMLRKLIGRYLEDPDSPFARWLLGRAAHEVGIEIEPRSMLTWDYGRRMTRRD